MVPELALNNNVSYIGPISLIGPILLPSARVRRKLMVSTFGSTKITGAWDYCFSLTVNRGLNDIERSPVLEK